MRLVFMLLGLTKMVTWMHWEDHEIPMEFTPRTHVSALGLQSRLLRW